MLFAETIIVALSALRANKLRSFLTMLGIIIGVSAVIAMLALGKGAQAEVYARIAKLGTTLLQVSPERVRQNGIDIPGVSKRLTMEDVEAVNARAMHVIAVQPQQDKNMQVTFRNRNTNTQITGTTPNCLEVRNYSIDAGRMFTSAEDLGRQRVAIVGQQVLANLGVTPEAILDEPIRIQSVQFTVIGILHTRAGVAGWNQDDQVIIPFNTGRFRMFGTDRLNNFSVLARDDASVPDAMAEVTTILRRTHRIHLGQADDFSVKPQTDFLAAASESSEVFSYLLAGIAAVSLLVGGIGIMNIMLVSVTERTREIGVRKALGATRTNILLQFLIEALVLCFMGGVLGASLGVGASLAFRDYAGWHIVVDVPSICLAFAFAACIGLLFGVWPARRASRLDPIAALRYE